MGKPKRHDGMHYLTSFVSVSLVMPKLINIKLSETHIDTYGSPCDLGVCRLYKRSRNFTTTLPMSASRGVAHAASKLRVGIIGTGP